MSPNTFNQETQGIRVIEAITDLASTGAFPRDMEAAKEVVRACMDPNDDLEEVCKLIAPYSGAVQKLQTDDKITFHTILGKFIQFLQPAIKGLNAAIELGGESQNFSVLFQRSHRGVLTKLRCFSDFYAHNELLPTYRGPHSLLEAARCMLKPIENLINNYTVIRFFRLDSQYSKSEEMDQSIAVILSSAVGGMSEGFLHVGMVAKAIAEAYEETFGEDIPNAELKKHLKSVAIEMDLKRMAELHFLEIKVFDGFVVSGLNPYLVKIDPETNKPTTEIRTNFLECTKEVLFHLSNWIEQERQRIESDGPLFNTVESIETEEGMKHFAALREAILEEVNYTFLSHLSKRPEDAQLIILAAEVATRSFAAYVLLQNTDMKRALGCPAARSKVLADWYDMATGMLIEYHSHANKGDAHLL